MKEKEFVALGQAYGNVPHQVLRYGWNTLSLKDSERVIRPANEAAPSRKPLAKRLARFSVRKIFKKQCGHVSAGTRLEFDSFQRALHATILAAPITD
jgi:hypothetical protein